MINSKNNTAWRPRNKEYVIGGDECNVESVIETRYSISQSLHTLVNFEDEQEVTTFSKYLTFNEFLHLKHPKPEAEMKFEDPAQFIAFIRHYGCENGYDLKFSKNESDKILKVCKLDGCPCKAFASWNRDKTKYILKSLQREHNCETPLDYTDLFKELLGMTPPSETHGLGPSCPRVQAA